MQAFILLTLQLFHKRLKQLARSMKFLKRSNDALAGLMITTSPLSARAAASCTAVSRFSTSDNRGMLALDILHTLANLGCSSAGEQQQLYMVADS